MLMKTSYKNLFFLAKDPKIGFKENRYCHLVSFHKIGLPVGYNMAPAFKFLVIHLNSNEI